MLWMGELFNFGLSKYGLVCFSVLWFEVLMKVFFEFNGEFEFEVDEDDFLFLR